MPGKSEKRAPRLGSPPISGRTRPLAAVAQLPRRRPGLLAAVAVSTSSDGVLIRFADGVEELARVAPFVDPAVVATAARRGEALILQEEPLGLVVIGALRTSSTPGIEKGDDYVIEARRVKLVGDHEVSLVSGTAGVVLRAMGVVETIARDITARAAGVHRIVGRLIHLN
jgi:hypothetical protein